MKKEGNSQSASIFDVKTNSRHRSLFSCLESLECLKVTTLDSRVISTPTIWSLTWYELSPDYFENAKTFRSWLDSILAKRESTAVNRLTSDRTIDPEMGSLTFPIVRVLQPLLAICSSRSRENRLKTDGLALIRGTFLFQAAKHATNPGGAGGAEHFEK